ncbi:DUF3039 domain-containing protein [Corynebacterium sp. S7]
MHNRRARPTLRVLREDLTSDWDSPHPLRLLKDDKFDELHPLSELPHPIVRKAVESFSENAEDDIYVTRIHSSTQLQLLEIKQSQWRGGVWQDPSDGVCWLLVAGLAKGGHLDTDDFYKVIERENDSDSIDRWLPTEEDHQLLKRETAARLRTEWELNIQQEVLKILQDIHSGGTARIAIDHPIKNQGHFATIQFEVPQAHVELTSEDFIDTEEFFIEIHPDSKYAGSNLLWAMTIRILISINPPEQNWDRFGNTFSAMEEPGTWLRRIETLSQLVESGELGSSVPGEVSHYSHRKHLAGKTINGSAVRSLCGKYFVPRQDHESLAKCLECEKLYSALPN